MTDEQVATAAPPAEGVQGQTPEPQATVPSSDNNGDGQPQEAGQTQVEGQEQRPTSNEAERRRPSDFYRDRNEMKKLRSTIYDQQNQLRQISELLQNMNKSSAPVQNPQTGKFDFDSFVADPDKFLSERDKKVAESIMQQMEQRQTHEQRERNVQEALELIFPKSDGNDRRDLASRIEADEERKSAIQDILISTKLDELSKTHPIEAARIANQLYEMQKSSEQPKAKNPNVIKKSLLGSTATGSSSAGGKQMPTLAEIQTQSKKLDAEVDRNPDLRLDEGFKQKQALIKQQLVALHGELTKGNR